MKVLVDTFRYYLCTIFSLMVPIGLYYGGNWVWLGASTFLIMMVLDLILPRDFSERKVIPFLADLVMYLQLPILVSMYATLVMSVNEGRIDIHNPWQVAGIIASIAWITVVPTLPLAHELMHRRHWFPRLIARLELAFMFAPGRDRTHVHEHHLYLDTPQDPDTPLRGETIYQFVPKCFYRNFKAAFELEAEALRKQGKSPWSLSNQMYVDLFLMMLPTAFVAYFGGAQLAVIAAVTQVIARVVVEGFNYFQHYGLVRVPGAPVKLHHTWNHMGTIARIMGFEITNHIHHHYDGYIPFYELKPEPNSPQMPSVFICFVASFIPPIWFNLISKPLLKKWDNENASPEEIQLAKEANARAGWPDWFEKGSNKMELKTA